MRRLLLSLTALLALGPAAALAADPPTAEARLREQVRALALQARTAEGELATLQATLAQVEDLARQLAEQNTALTKRLAADKEAADKALAAAKATADHSASEATLLRVDLAKATALAKQNAELAAATEARRVKSAGEAVTLQRRVSDQQARNAAMYRLGMEVLGRYERFGLGDALTAREPFVGITRVKFQNLVQDYSDQLTDQRIKP